MHRKEKENNSHQSNYRCGKNGGIYLTLDIGRKSGQNPFSLCSEMMRILRASLSGLCCVCATRNLRHYFREAGFKIKRPDSWASTWLLCCVTLTRSFQWSELQLLLLEKLGDDSCPRSLTRGVLKKTQWDNGLARTQCNLGNHKDVNVHDSFYCLVFIRLVLGQGQSGEYVWKAKTQTCTDTHMKQFPMKL